MGAVTVPLDDELSAMLASTAGTGSSAISKSFR